jgi:hypothetical protein
MTASVRPYEGYVSQCEHIMNRLNNLPQRFSKTIRAGVIVIPP